MTLNSLTVPALKVIKDAIKAGDVGTARWLMEMNLGKARQQVDVEAEVAGKVDVQLKSLTTEELQGLLSILRERGPV